MSGTDDVVEFVREWVLPELEPRPKALLIVGSHAEGTANFASDLDLVAIVAPPARGRARVVQKGMEVGNQDVGVTSLTADTVRSRLRALDRTYRTGAYMSDNIATRLAAALVVHDETGVGRALVDEARAFRPAAATWDALIDVALSFYKDAWGSIQNGQPDTAVLMARQAAAVTVDLCLLDHGVRSLKPKWHLHRLRSAGAEDLLTRYVRVLGLEQIDRDAALQVFAQMDRMLCEVLEIETLHEFDDSPFRARTRDGVV